MPSNNVKGYIMEENTTKSKTITALFKKRSHVNLAAMINESQKVDLPHGRPTSLVLWL